MPVSGWVRVHAGALCWLLFLSVLVVVPSAMVAVRASTDAAVVADLPPLPATPAPAPGVEQAGDFGAVDEVQPEALLPDGARHLAGRRVVARTEKMTVFDNEDGTSTAVVGAAAMNWQDGAGRWRAIDPRLDPVAGGRWRTASGPVRIELAETRPGGGGGVVVSGQGWSAGV